MNGKRATTRTAIERAADRWSQQGRRFCEAAVHVRGKLRESGVRGTLRLLDDYASGERGNAAPDQLATFVRFARDNGMGEADVQLALRQMCDGLTGDVFAERDRRKSDKRA